MLNLGFQEMSRLALIGLWLWPLVLVGAVAAIRRGRLRHPLAFVVLGYLASVGAASFASRFVWGGVWWFFAPRAEGDQILTVMANGALTQAVVGLVASALPVWWLARLLGVNNSAI